MGVEVPMPDSDLTVIRDSKLCSLLDRAERVREELEPFRLVHDEARVGYVSACRHVDQLERELQRRLLAELGR